MKTNANSKTLPLAAAVATAMGNMIATAALWWSSSASRVVVA